MLKLIVAVCQTLLVAFLSFLIVESFSYMTKNIDFIDIDLIDIDLMYIDLTDSEFFNNSLIEQDPTQKHLGLTLDHNLTFQYQVNEKIKKAMKGIGLLRKEHRTFLLNIYKSFMRPHLDYGDAVYDQSSNGAFSNKLGTVQYNTALAITGAIKGKSREKLYQELGLEYFHQIRWMRRFCLFYKVVSTKLPAYIYDFIPPVRPYQKHPNSFNSFSCRTEYFQNSFFPCVIYLTKCN